MKDLVLRPGMEPRSPALGVQSHSHVPPGRLPPKAPSPEVHGPSPGWGGQQPEGDDLAEAPELRSKVGLNLQLTSFMCLWEAGPASLLGVQNMESAQAPGVLNELGQLDPPTSCCFQPRGWRVQPGESGAHSKGLASSPTAPSDHAVVPDHDSICRAPGPRPGLSHLAGRNGLVLSTPRKRTRPRGHQGQTAHLGLCNKLGKNSNPWHRPPPVLTRSHPGKSLLMETHGLACSWLQHTASTPSEPSR